MTPGLSLHTGGDASLSPTSIWAHRADKRGECRGLRSLEARPTSYPRGWQQKSGMAGRDRLGHLLEEACLLSKGAGPLIQDH